MIKTETSKILEIGEEAQEMVGVGMLILFGDQAPVGLREYCLIHDQGQKIDCLSVNDKLVIGDHQYTVCEVGATAVESFNTIGHVTLKFNQTDNLLSGSIHLQEELCEFPDVEDEIAFLIAE
ncbi:PTS sorbitol transporter subunit IIA [Enterococcus avium]|nr:PTS sorbitol transporter subunit IIA [Enterococcus avium]